MDVNILYPKSLKKADRFLEDAKQLFVAISRFFVRTRSKEPLYRTEFADLDGRMHAEPSSPALEVVCRILFEHYLKFFDTSIQQLQGLCSPDASFGLVRYT
jgi:hypothetical protein